ncbi:hypothetical protein WH50_18770 [Pokkaliibacter plantistimulans]|uniref:HTH luxR-type domain-containing protein n=1 Tax=Pokkaliibacter plantistimulans TaxID=1635171 RepID=A0ABX5LSY8_9GAMM|nr:response regulator transcription factor [Pokkaliibacter plantistimulans]PXF29786.1 hypothetical protein WH50_18770 [Pokkaliibacter plantistimulans]
MDILFSRNDSLCQRVKQALHPYDVWLVEALGEFKPDVIWLHHHGEDGLDKRVANLKDIVPDTAIVVLSNVPGNKEGMSVIMAGAQGYMNSFARPDVFRLVRDTVVSGHVWLGQSLMLALVAQLGNVAGIGNTLKEQGLNSREEELLRCLSIGLNNQQIAEQLSLSEQTIKNQLSALYKKYGVKDRLSLVLAVSNMRREAEYKRYGEDA